MREITTHHALLTPGAIKIHAAGTVGPGGAYNRYEITGFDTATNKANEDALGYRASFSKQVILFQNGNPATEGINGLTLEALIAIAADRLEGFQAGPFPCYENGMALTNLKAALEWLHRRTQKLDPSAALLAKDQGLTFTGEVHVKSE